MNDVAFPLTPALSRRERGNCLQRFDKYAVGFCSTVKKVIGVASGCSLSLGERLRVRGNRISKMNSPEFLQKTFR
jgi:hypothetical protein